MRFYYIMQRITSLFFLLFVLSFHVAEAQVGQSPYTVKGIGSINSLATGRNLGMGGVGIGNSHHLYLNNMNPAMLSRNTFYTTFEAGLSVERRQLDTREEQHNTGSGGLDYLSLAFPLLYEKWGFNIGLAPYSTVSYDMVTTRPIEGVSDVTTSYSFSGSGGTTQAYAATGVRLFKGLSAGVRASYIFGAISEKIANGLNTGTGKGTGYGTIYNVQTTFSDVLLTGGMAYRYQLPNKKDRFVMAGLTYDLETNLNAERTREFERASSPLPVIKDTLNGAYFLPARIGTGISFERLYRYTVAADFVMQDWEQYQNLEGTPDSGLGKSYRMALGGEWTPDYSSAKVGTYYKRMTYRMGLQYEKTPFVVDGNNINDFGINFGVTLPVSNASSIHTSFLFGQRGKIENDLIRERYFRLSLGVTFNDRWFTKVRYD